MNYRAYPKNGKKRYNIAGREPWALPEEKIPIPPPPDLPTPPSSVSLLTLLLPPVIMIAGSLISALVMGRANLLVMLPMLLMGFGYPTANLITNKLQKKKYAEAVENRERDYITTLRNLRKTIERTIERQRRIMHEEFPNGQDTLAIGMAAGENKRLWWRRANDIDFMKIRLGLGMQALSFEIAPPTNLNQKDPLSELPFELLEHYDQISNMPFLVDFKRIGSLVVFGRNYGCVYRLIRRMLVDAIVHHSPDDLTVVVLGNRKNATEAWEWLKWTPHTHILDTGQHRQTLLFTTDKINSFLDDLKKLFYERIEANKGYHHDDSARVFGHAYLIVLDDVDVRQHEDIRRIAEEGWRVGIYLVFVSDYNVPSTCRARIEIDQNGVMDYLETYEVLGAGNHRNGHAEFVSKSEAEPLARTLAGIAIAGGKGSMVLPSLVRVADLIPEDPYAVSEIVQRWRSITDDSDQVQLPVGQYVDRDGLATYEIDFRPESIGGKGAYHAMMIGTTGSGKSIFMQSLVLAAAHRYSPKHINFMFMDFKAGAAELKKVSNLPHSVGMVTDLSRELADRALQALEYELSRRKIAFDQAGKITDIWDYNRRFPDQTFPHLVVMIDEFAEGIKILPNLVERLKELGRQGRAFGMYFFLANQEVNSAVEALKANVSWYVLLKVNRQEEMRLIGQRLPIPPGRGRGYVRVKSDITSIQSAYAGLPANVGDLEESDINEYVIATFGPDGQRNEVFRHDPRKRAAGGTKIQSELELLTSVISEAARILKVPPADPIYTEPLAPVIPFVDILQDLDLFRLFNGQAWERQSGEKHVIPLGFLDIPQRCQQIPFSINFNEGGGHLWIIGSPGSGKNMVLLNLAVMLCLTHQPSEVNLYVLDFGNGLLGVLNQFPHVADTIRSHERERLDRLLRFLQSELNERTGSDWHMAGKPEIFLFVNNVADLRQSYPNQAEELGRFIRSGGAAGIHVIITSNRGSELPRSLSGNIMTRIVLQLTDEQEYLDILNARVPRLTMRTEGRGYFLDEGNVAECQVALLEESAVHFLRAAEGSTRRLIPQDETAKESYLEALPAAIKGLALDMQNSWEGETPYEIRAMDDVLSLADFNQIVEGLPQTPGVVNLPLGLLYEDLSPVIADLGDVGTLWTVLGGRSSGKSSALMGMSYFLLEQLKKNVEITLVPFRRGPLAQLVGKSPQIEVLLQPEAIVDFLSKYVDRIIDQPDRFFALMIDDISIAFTSGNTELVSALNSLGDRLRMVTQENFLIVIADLYSNIKPQAFASSLIKLFQQSQTGIFFSLDDTDMQWFNTRVSMLYLKTLKWVSGRGFLVAKGNADYVQTPLVTPEDFSN